MPIYEYVCGDCQASFEMIRSIKNADADLNCVMCQSENVKRSISLFNATSGERSIAGDSGCSNCAGGSCNTCNPH
ncbi:MAG: FmdB family zinc ribbon protein [Chloroflexota bacterium]|jgi:putative FmdB family regulatory protein|nr:FmdB family zinc ribbon protein [Chloroflexota bacterium]